MRSILLSDGKGKFLQKPIRVGITYDVSEEELSFHVKRQAGKKILEIKSYEINTPLIPITTKIKETKKRTYRSRVVPEFGE
jgi:hypothetical protein